MTTSHSNQPLDFAQINRVLITKLRYHGDVLLSSPVFQALKNHHAHIQIDALIYKDTLDMLSLHPAIENIFTIDKAWKNLKPWQQFYQEWRLLQQLSARRYDLIIHLTEHWRGFYLKHLLNIPYAVTAHYRRRENNRLWQRSFTHIYPVPPVRQKAASHIDALRFLGIPASAQEEQPSLFISQQDRQYVHQLLQKNGLSGKHYILTHPTSRFFYKCWPPKTMASFINQLTDRDHKIVVTAAPSPQEASYIKEMKKWLSKSVVDMSGQLTLKQLAAAIEQSQSFVGVDSAPMHIAAAVNTPIVALFGPTNTQVWGPNSNNCTIIQSNTATKPALKNRERSNDLDNCTLDIDVEAVVQATLNTIGQ